MCLYFDNVRELLIIDISACQVLTYLARNHVYDMSVNTCTLLYEQHACLIIRQETFISFIVGSHVILKFYNIYKKYI